MRSWSIRPPQHIVPCTLARTVLVVTIMHTYSHTNAFLNLTLALSSSLLHFLNIQIAFFLRVLDKMKGQKCL